MHGLELPAAIAGTLIILVALWDTFETMILPRGNSAGLRVTRFYFRGIWNLWRFIALRFSRDNPVRQSMLAVFGPLSLVFLIVLWANLLIWGFGLLLFGIGSSIAPQTGLHAGNFGDYLYLSGVTLFTLGYGDKVPNSTPTKFLCVTESGIGFGLLATVIGYLPTLYQTFARRETMVLRLYARTRDLPTAQALVQVHCDLEAWNALEEYLLEWEKWGAELLEAYRSYPVLAFYRSQQDEESWLTAAIVALELQAWIQHLCPIDAKARKSLLLQAKSTHDILSFMLTDLCLRIYPGTDRSPTDILADRLLLVLPQKNLPNDDPIESTALRSGNRRLPNNAETNGDSAATGSTHR